MPERLSPALKEIAEQSSRDFERVQRILNNPKRHSDKEFRIARGIFVIGRKGLNIDVEHEVLSLELADLIFTGLRHYDYQLPPAHKYKDYSQN